MRTRIRIRRTVAPSQFSTRSAELHSVWQENSAEPQAAAPGAEPAVSPFALAFRLWYYLSMKIALSIPNDLFDSAEKLSKKLGVSRSHLYATALAEFLAKHRGRKTTDRLNSVYASEDSRLDTRLRRLQGRSLGESTW